MGDDVRLSYTTLKVLKTLLDSSSEKLSGADIIRKTGIVSGTLYPMLLRLEAAGWLIGEWERIDPSEWGRPRKHLYKLTSLGRRSAGHALMALRLD